MHMYEKLTQHIWDLESDDFQVKSSPYIEYSESVNEFIRDFHSFCSEHPEFVPSDFKETLKANGIEWELDSMTKVDESKLNDQCIIALFSGVIRSDRFCEGAFLNYLENGAIVRWLKHLLTLDAQNGGRHSHQVYTRV